MPGWLAPWMPFLIAVVPVLITGIVALRWGDAAVKAKDATIEALKQQNETLKLYDVKAVNDRYEAIKQSVDELSEHVAALRKENQDLSEKWRQTRAVAEVLVEAGDRRVSAENWLNEVVEGLRKKGVAVTDEEVEGWKARAETRSTSSKSAPENVRVGMNSG